MQPEILKFLLDSSDHLRSDSGEDANGEQPIDFQAVDRMLPDHDWFESVVEPETRGVPPAVQPGLHAIELEF